MTKWSFGDFNMKKNLLNNGMLIYFLTIVFTLSLVASCLVSANYTISNTVKDYEFENSPNQNEQSSTIESSVIYEINWFLEKILSTSEDCWRKPSSQRKNTIISKLSSLQELISQWRFEEAYSKMLHDIKPKLTALKTNENEESWGNGVFKQAWVVCEDLREEFRVDCNFILNLLIGEQPH